jgi:hypothetical protein
MVVPQTLRLGRSGIRPPSGHASTTSRLGTDPKILVGSARQGVGMLNGGHRK